MPVGEFLGSETKSSPWRGVCTGGHKSPTWETPLEYTSPQVEHSQFPDWLESTTERIPTARLPNWGFLSLGKILLHIGDLCCGGGEPERGFSLGNIFSQLQWGGGVMGSELHVGTLAAKFTTENPGASAKCPTHSPHFFWQWRSGRQVLLRCCQQ